MAAIFSDTCELESTRKTLNQIYIESIADDVLPSERSQSWPEWVDSTSDETDPTTLSLLSWKISDEDDDYEESGVPGDKLGHLTKMFPKQTQFTLRNTLDKCQGDVGRAVDELLNRVFLNEDPEEPQIKGIDGFETGINVNEGKKKRRNRKGKAKGNENRRSASFPNENTSTPATNTWESMSYEIKHLATSLNLPEKSVASVYHRQGGALAPTIVSLLDNNAPPTASLDPTHLEELHQLSTEFGAGVKLDHLETLLKLCQENKTAVFELTEILCQHSTKPTIKVNTTSLPSTPSSLSPTNPRYRDANTNGWTIVGASYASPSNLPSPPISPRSTHRILTPYSAAQILATHSTARNEAFAKAADSHRKSRSNPLMGGAASYYANLGHHHNAQVKTIRDDIAERIVEANSKPNMLDLHGATVAQAVKIAREQTTDWWVRQMREQELSGGAGGAGWGRNAVEPFHIVTGLGRHSKDGVPQLMPAVSRMLLKENWKIQVEQGHIVVYGVSKAKR